MIVENTLSPCPIDKPISGEAGLNEEQVTQYKKGITPLIPLGRIGPVDEIAKPALFLALIRSLQRSINTGHQLVMLRLSASQSAEELSQIVRGQSPSAIS